MSVKPGRDRRVSRRRFLQIGGTSAAAVALGAGGFSASPTWAGPRFRDYLFSLGVASGDPRPDGMVLWTRLAPDPLAADGRGGMPEHVVPVRWEVAADEGFRRVVRRGTALATPDLGHSVHVEVEGLEPARHYWYRFETGPQTSPVGRTKTAPDAGSDVATMRFAFASCQQWQTGYYAAYRHMAEEELDLVVHLGDYIYEGTIRNAEVRPALPPEHVRPEPFTLEQYRLRYALYKADPDLQGAHAAFPWLATWDDHEVENNWAGEAPQNPAEYGPGDWERRKAAAFQAYYEHLPLRPSALPAGAGMRLHRGIAWGDLAEVAVLDTRQYRSDQGCGPGDRVPPCPEFDDPSRTMLGDEQERWLLERLSRSRARWNVLTAQVIMARFDYRAGPEAVYSGDKWDGYAPARQRLLDFLARRRPANPVVLSGDAHVNLVSDLKLDFGDRGSETVATEFTGTAITSGGVNLADDVAFRRPIEEASHIKYYEGFNRGYVRCTLDRDQWRADYRAVDTRPVGTRGAGRVTSPEAGIHTQASWVIEDGRPGAEPA